MFMKSQVILRLILQIIVVIDYEVKNTVLKPVIK
jgi:hypothetical protein